MIQDNDSKKSILSKIIQHHIAELLESLRVIDNELHDIREIVWSLEEKLREEGMNGFERKI